MPNRIIREGILSSEKIAALGWAEEVFYRRLQSIVDDYGRTEANLQLLRSKCYPLQTDKVKPAQIGVWLDEIAKAGLVVVYEVEGKTYLEIVNFGQQIRSKSKYPAPSLITDSKCLQVIGNEHLGVSVFGVVSEDVSVSAASLQRFEDFWKSWPKSERKQDKAKCSAKWKAEKLDAIADRILADIATKRQTQKWQGGFIEAPLVYLNNRRWEDGVTPDALPGAPSISDPDSKAAVEAEGVRLGVGKWNNTEQWPVYKARVRAAQGATA